MVVLPTPVGPTKKTSESARGQEGKKMEMKDFSLEGKVALVTGASYGIGFAIAEGMAKAGATIVFNDIRQELVDKGLADVYKRQT